MTPFESLLPLLIDAIPEAIASMKLAKPICIVRIYYYDTHAPHTYLMLKTVSDECRTQVLANQGRDALSQLWASGADCGDGATDLPPERPSSKTQKQIAKLFRQVDDLLSDEDEHMVPLRQLVQQVARELNARDWKASCPVTDDFVVVAADGSQHFADDYDDIANSIPLARLDLLRSRGLLGPGEQWEHRPGYTYAGDEPTEMARMVQEIEERARAMSPKDQMDYWIGQLDRMAAGETCDMTRIETNPHFPLDHLAEIGNSVVVPLLQFACRWADKLEWDSDDIETANETPMSEVILFALWKVKELGHADRQIELLLREFLERSCRANEGRSLWGTLPFHCADCLHELFDRFPESEVDKESNALKNRAAYLRVPLP